MTAQQAPPRPEGQSFMQLSRGSFVMNDIQLSMPGPELKSKQPITFQLICIGKNLVLYNIAMIKADTCLTMVW